MSGLAIWFRKSSVHFSACSAIVGPELSSRKTSSGLSRSIWAKCAMTVKPDGQRGLAPVLEAHDFGLWSILCVACDSQSCQSSFFVQAYEAVSLLVTQHKDPTASTFITCLKRQQPTVYSGVASRPHYDWPGPSGKKTRVRGSAGEAGLRLGTITNIPCLQARANGAHYYVRTTLQPGRLRLICESYR